MSEALRVDGARLWATIEEMAKVGATAAGGCNRQALSDEDRAGRALFLEWCAATGLEHRIDAIGNLFVRRAGLEVDGASVLIGSHLDTQPTGGRFDGVYGVLAGLEVLRTLADAERSTRHPIEVAVWTNEEGSRFAPAMMGSGVWAGALELDEVYAARDRDGRSVREELARTGFLGPVPASAHRVHAAFEVHIEQGPVLEEARRQIGVVNGVQGMRWYDLAIDGVASHAGTTPMELRRDPLRALASVLNRFERDRSAHGDRVRATFGVVRSTPDSRNTVPERVCLSVDLRHPETPVLDALEALLGEILEAEAQRTGTVATLTRIWDCAPVVFDAACVDAVRRASERLGCASLEMVSGAGHDSVYVSRVAPTAMIFVPCAGGLSHNEAESATPADLTAGCDVLLHAVLDRDAA